MRKIMTDASPFIERFPGSLCGAGVLVIKCDMLMDEITDGLNASPSVWR